MDELNEKIKRVFADLGIRCAYNMPSFWANGGKDYVVIPTRYAKGYQKALEDAEREITEVLSEQPEIIRCKDCKYCDSYIAEITSDGNMERIEYRCKDFHASVMPDEYCSRGERRDV